jgi:Mlc titration factor MtfA (ptsG expression regulator)
MWRRLSSAWRRSREARAVARRPIPDDLWKRTLARYAFLRRRDAGQAQELRRLVSLFLDRKEFSAVGGLRLRNDVVVAIAAQACLPVLRLGLDRYDGFVGIVVHPGAVVARREHTDEAGVVHEYDEPLSGEAMEGGPVMLSWDDVRRAGQSAGAGYNVVIHEFAHVLDMADGIADGVPLLPPELPRRDWVALLRHEHESLQARVRAGEATALDPYAAQSPEELFAVASEAFFVSPALLMQEHPALYGVFVRFYGQDPLRETP